MQNRRALAIVTLAATGLLAACSADKTAPADTTASAANSAAASASTSGEAVPAAGGKVIVVQLVTDGTGNRFEPNKIEAHPGDLLRFTLKAGVHNVDFLPDSNPGKTGLPKASELLQLPGQTFDVPVTFAKGKYYFQCDPHALLGMTGKLEVE